MNRILKVLVSILALSGLAGCTFEAGVEPLALTYEPADTTTELLAAPGAERTPEDADQAAGRLAGDDAAGRLAENEDRRLAGTPEPTATPSPEPSPTVAARASATSAAPPATRSSAGTASGAGPDAAADTIFDFPPPTPAGPVPEIAYFTGYPLEVDAGGTVTLSWEADGDAAELWVQSPRGTLRHNYGPVPLSGSRTITLDPAWGPQVNFGLSVDRLAINYGTTRQVDIWVRCTAQPDGPCLPYTPTPTPTPAPAPEPDTGTTAPPPTTASQTPESGAGGTPDAEGETP